jgi:hypothetical protein
MKGKLLIILFFSFLTTLSAQAPQFTWGSPIDRDPEKLQNIEIVGVNDKGFFATYESGGQVMLEYFDDKSERLWATVLIPKTPKNQISKFHSVQMIRGKLYMISSKQDQEQTVVYAQHIKHNGNYAPKIYTIARGKHGKKIKLATSDDDSAMIVVLSGDNKQSITSVLLNNKLTPRWSQTISSTGIMQDVLVHSSGTAFILTKALPAAPATTSFFLYCLNARTGKQREVILGDGDYRPLKAKLSATTQGETVVAGYVIPSSSVANQNPEPVGTFYYRFNELKLDDPIISYTPFESRFIESYKRLKPDNDVSQRLRHLQLHKTVPTSDGGVILIGEVSYKGIEPNAPLQHHDDVVIIRMKNDGTIVYMTSANKLQASFNGGAKLHSYFATSKADTLKVIYLDFAYNDSSNDDQITKSPVMISILPDGSKRISPLEGTTPQPDEDFHLLPSSVYPVSDQEFILLGVGDGYYRYGRMEL